MDQKVVEMTLIIKNKDEKITDLEEYAKFVDISLKEKDEEVSKLHS